MGGAVREGAKLRFKRTSLFRRWLQSIADKTTRDRINRRLAEAENGNFGKVRSVGDGVFEMQLDFGPGYRIYYCQAGMVVYWLLCGGDKDTQSDDIRMAKRAKRALEEKHGTKR
jgi:putative addiction module killer protein